MGTQTTYEGADEIVLQNNKLLILEKGKVIAIEAPQRRGTTIDTKSAWVVKTPKPTWKIKFIKS
jgi:hypothetical protein